MSILRRMSDLVQGKVNAALDAAEDPNQAVDLSYEKQLERLQQVRRNVADVLTSAICSHSPVTASPTCVEARAAWYWAFMVSFWVRNASTLACSFWARTTSFCSCALSCSIC